MMKNMCKKLVLCVLALSMVLSMASAVAQSTDDSLQKIIDKGEMVLGLDASFAPMGFTDDEGNIVGYDIDLAQEVCDRLGIKLKCQPIDWLAKEMELNAGNIDCIWNGLSINDSRMESMCLSQPYLANDQVLVVLADSQAATMADLAGKKVGLQGASSAEEALNDATDFKATLGEVIPFDDYAIALMDLDVGGVDAVLMDEVVANYYITEKQADYRILDETLVPEEYAIGFRKADEALCKAVNDTLLAMVEDGKMEEITVKWFGENVSLIGAQAEQ